ncbi:MAG: class C sortase [Clostridia bacterium]|nr:class C sortase [Clostridia bacterium]
MKKHGTTVLLIIIFIVGMVLLLYPTLSNWWNEQHQSRAIASYSETIEKLDKSKIDEFITGAREFNQIIKSKRGLPSLTEDEMKIYNSVLDITNTGVMAYIEIPTIDVSLPVYHSVSDDVLQVAVGHIEWSSLPIGGESTHCVLSGHRGLPSAKLFTNLDRLVIGDIFMLHILDTTITYQVDQVLIVEPEDISTLKIDEGKDLCTLVTCTPYGINSHRLLVRGTRIDNIEEAPVINVISEAGQIDPLIIAPIVATPLLLMLLIYVLVKYRKKK